LRGLPRKDLRTDLQELELAKKREDVQGDIISFHKSTAQLFPMVDLDDYNCFKPPITNPEIHGEHPEDYSQYCLDSEEHDNPFIVDEEEPEDVEIPLPSAFDPLPTSMKGARRKEIRMRIAQANDALENIRLEIGNKSYLYRSNIRLADGKKQKTRGYAAVKSADAGMRHHLRLYNHATWALDRLDAPQQIRSRFQQINREHTKAITAIYQPNAAGQSGVTLSWIWTVDIQGDSSKSPYLEERVVIHSHCWSIMALTIFAVYRVNWLKAKSRLDRAEEENILLESEMVWVCNFFQKKLADCLSWARVEGISAGHQAYAHRQGETWKLLRMEAETSFARSLERGEGIRAELRNELDGSSG
jgi:hypothetical protein